MNADTWTRTWAKGETNLSWYQPKATVALEIVDELAPSRVAPVIDVGGGSSPFIAALSERGFSDLTVLDATDAGFGYLRDRLGTRSEGVEFIVADLAEWKPARSYSLWHDRAVFHFFTEEAERRHYLVALKSALPPDGVALIATFALDGPQQCSGLPVRRYDAEGLAAALGDDFELLLERREEHTTPAGRMQPFTWVAARRR